MIGQIEKSYKIIQSYYQTNLIAFITISHANKETKLKKEKDSHILTLYNLATNEILTEFRFHHKIRNFLLTKNQLTIIFKNNIYLFDLFSFENIDKFSTYTNCNGIVAITSCDSSPYSIIIAYPDEAKGYVRVRDYEKNTSILLFIDDSGISSMAITNAVPYLAVAASTGVVIKIIDYRDGAVVQVLKRGIGEAYINCIVFDNKALLLSATSNKGTVHVWTVERKDDKGRKTFGLEGDENKKRPMKKSRVSVIKNLFFSSNIEELSFASMHLNEKMSVCSFDNTGTGLFVVGQSGMVYYGKIDFVKGGEITIERRFTVKEKRNHINIKNHSHTNKNEEKENSFEVI